MPKKHAELWDREVEKEWESMSERLTLHNKGYLKDMESQWNVPQEF